MSGCGYHGTLHMFRQTRAWGNLKWSWFWRLCKEKPQFIRHLGNAKNQKKLCLNSFTIQSINSRVVTLGVYICLQNNSVYSFDEHLLSISCVPDTVLDIRDGAVNGTELLIQGSPSSQGEQQHTNQRVCLPSGGDRCYVEKQNRGGGQERGRQALFYIGGQGRFLKRWHRRA